MNVNILEVEKHKTLKRIILSEAVHVQHGSESNWEFPQPLKAYVEWACLNKTFKTIGFHVIGSTALFLRKER